MKNSLLAVFVGFIMMTVGCQKDLKKNEVTTTEAINESLISVTLAYDYLVKLRVF